MFKNEILSLLGRKGKKIAGEYYSQYESIKMIQKDWFSGGFNQLVTDAVNHALSQIGSESRIEILSSNTANAVASKIDTRG